MEGMSRRHLGTPPSCQSIHSTGKSLRGQGVIGQGSAVKGHCLLKEYKVVHHLTVDNVCLFLLFHSHCCPFLLFFQQNYDICKSFSSEHFPYFDGAKEDARQSTGKTNTRNNKELIKE